MHWPLPSRQRGLRPPLHQRPAGWLHAPARPPTHLHVRGGNVSSGKHLHGAAPQVCQAALVALDAVAAVVVRLLRQARRGQKGGKQEKKQTSEECKGAQGARESRESSGPASLKGKRLQPLPTREA
jgi:hypothetical protein